MLARVQFWDSIFQENSRALVIWFSAHVHSVKGCIYRHLSGTPVPLCVCVYGGDCPAGSRSVVRRTRVTFGRVYAETSATDPSYLHTYAFADQPSPIFSVFSVVSVIHDTTISILTTPTVLYLCTSVQVGRWLWSHATSRQPHRHVTDEINFPTNNKAENQLHS